MFKKISHKLFTFFIIYSLISVIFFSTPNVSGEGALCVNIPIISNYSENLTDYQMKLELRKGVGENSNGIIYLNDNSEWGEPFINEDVELSWINHSPDTECDEFDFYTYTFTTNYTSSFSLTSNANWLSIGSSNGTIYGKALPGIFYINVTASYLTKEIYYNYTLTITDIILYWINYEPNEYGDNNTTYNYTFTVNLTNVTFSLSTNATWLFLGATNGTLYGIAINGTYYVNVTATFEDEVIYYNYTLTIVVGEDMDELLILVWLIIMLILLLISLKEPVWGLIGGIVWIVGGLLEFVDLNLALGLIVISIGMFIMLYGILELFRR